MIQTGTYLNVIDNSGAKKVYCIKIISGYRKRYAALGDLILVSIKNLRTKRRSISKTKKGEIVKALIVRTKKGSKSLSGEHLCFLQNSVVLLNNQHKLIGTRIFGSLPKFFRYTKFFRLLSLSSGLNR